MKKSPFCPNPAFRVLVIVFETWIQRLSTSSLELALFVINDDGRDFRIASDVLLSREPKIELNYPVMAIKVKTYLVTPRISGTEPGSRMLCADVRMSLRKG